MRWSQASTLTDQSVTVNTETAFISRSGSMLANQRETALQVRQYRSRIPLSIPRSLNVMVPPPNFGTVSQGAIYRSGFPREENFSFLATLNLKTIM